MRRWFSLLVLLAAAGLLHGETSPASATIVIYNRDLPESVQLAKFYAQMRGIERDHLVPLSCSKDEEISREEFDSTIRDPLRDVFRSRTWWTIEKKEGEPQRVTATTVHFAAVIKGVPLKIRGTSDYPGDHSGPGPIGNRNEAAVDSELAVLGAFSQQISGAIPNPYFQSYRPIGELEGFPLLLACRLDGPSFETARRMIVDAVETEKTGLWGRAYVDGAHNLSGGLSVGDSWLKVIPPQMRRVGIPVVYDDTPEIFPDGYPMSDCALYFGWYTENLSGALASPGFRFLPGAVAVHIHSFSAATLRSEGSHWAGPLLSKGAAATLGNVYEPYLQMTSRLNVFSDRLLHGFTLGESAYMSTQMISWMSVMIGDPLYRPYAAWLPIGEKPEPETAASDWKNCHDFAIANASETGPEARARALHFAVRAKNAPMLEDLGLIEMSEGNLLSATTSFQQARAIYAKRDDILRVVLYEADALIRQNKGRKAAELIRSVLRIAADAPAAPLLKKIEAQTRIPAPKK